MKRQPLLSGVFVVLLALAATPLSAQTPGILTFSMNTTSTGGYSPKHLVAVWIENSSGTFIKTKVKYSSSSNYDHLGNWTSKSGQNTVDATSGATRTSHGTISFTWNGTNVSGTQVADGTYYVWVEMAWASSLTTGKTTTSFSFTKGPTADHQTPANLTNFSNISLDWVPAGGSVSLATSSVSGSPFCAGSSVVVGYSISSGSVNAGNIFTAQLSDAAGSFTNPVKIGSVSATASGSINASIPSTSASGTAYRIRVTSSNPAAMASDNGANLTIFAVTPVTISDNSGTLTSSASSGNQWYEQTKGIISGETNQTFSPTATGDYYTIVTDANNCRDTSNTLHVIFNSIDNSLSEKNISVYPNPTNGFINISSQLYYSNCTVRVENVSGVKVMDRKMNLNSGNNTIDLSKNPNGVYYITILQNGQELKYRIVLNR